MMTKESSQPNKSLIDGIATLQALAISTDPIGCRELARRLNFEPTRVNRLLKTLAYLGIAKQDSNRKYAPGPGMHVLAAQSLFASKLFKNAMPVLEKLQAYNHTVAMGVLWRDNVTYLYHAPPGVSPAKGLGRIGIYPATKSGIGLSLLASHDNSYAEKIYADTDIPNFPDGISSLIDTLDSVREQGYARVEINSKQHTIAINVAQPAEAAIGMSGWIPNETTQEIVDVLEQASRGIENQTSNETESKALDVGQPSRETV